MNLHRLPPLASQGEDGSMSFTVVFHAEIQMAKSCLSRGSQTMEARPEPQREVGGVATGSNLPPLSLRGSLGAATLQTRSTPSSPEPQREPWEQRSFRPDSPCPPLSLRGNLGSSVSPGRIDLIVSAVPWHVCAILLTRPQMSEAWHGTDGCNTRVHTQHAVLHVMAVPCLVCTGVLSASAVFANFR